MDTNKMREQFEAKFGRPHGVYWYPQFSRYMTTSNHVACVEHQGRWEAWKASREAVVVQLPNRASEAYREEFDDVEGGSFNEAAYIRDVRTAIEAQGLKVAP